MKHPSKVIDATSVSAKPHLLDLSCNEDAPLLDALKFFLFFFGIFLVAIWALSMAAMSFL
jgi:hypothetical protein